MVYCAYCGKSFTRKEHLERHLPSHTNVKPHRCSSCHLSFARRDLLQRHHSTYHEARDPMEPLSGGVPSVPGRTPIACLNCAQAKTGCDKRVPCARCADKNLECAARFARRSSKAAVRAAQASAAFNNQAQPPTVRQPAPSTQPSLMTNFNSMDIDQASSKADTGNHLSTADPVTTIDPRLRTSPLLSNMSPVRPLENFPSPDDFIRLAHEFVNPDPSYSDLLPWTDYGMDLDMYPTALPLSRPDMAIPTFTDLSDVSTQSDPTSSTGSIHTRQTSIMSMSDFERQSHKFQEPTLSTAQGSSTEIPEFEVVVAAEAAWPLARCNRPIYSGTCPRTAIVHLECLEQKSKQDGTWANLEKFIEQADPNASDLASVVPLTQGTRDKMLAITQGFLHKALEIHRGGRKSRFGSPSAGGDWNFLVLPPTKIIEYFLRSYVKSLTQYYTLVSSGCVDPNEMLNNSQASTLLVLLMIAQGAAAIPMSEARYLSAGLTETCRISLFDIIEKDVELSADPVTLRCALLFTLLGAWSGDKWLMDIAMGQRGMYLSMLRHAGMLEPQSQTAPGLNNSTTPDLQWQAWLHRESRNRLVYNWVMVDQELSLFHDTAPQLSITDLQCPLPGPEVLFRAPTAEAWQTTLQSIYGPNISPHLLLDPAINPSLQDLFQDFLHDKLSRRQGNLCPQQLRLLLHPLQALLCHLRQMLSCFSHVLSTRSRQQRRSISKEGTMHRLEEVQALLQKWYELSISMRKNNPGCAVTKCNLVLYHLISLNAVTCFPEIERLARKDGLEPLRTPAPNSKGRSSPHSAGGGVGGISFWDISLRHKKCIYQREEAIFHAGQVMRLLNEMESDKRPAWWSAALYRATMILWADSLARLDPGFGVSSPPTMNVALPTQIKPSPKQATQGLSPPTEGSSPQGPNTPSAAQQVGGGGAMLVYLDRLTPEESVLGRFLWHGEGVPVLSGPNGTSVTLDNPDQVLRYGVRVLEEGVSTRIGDGIKRKLVKLGENWKAEGVNAPMGASPMMPASVAVGGTSPMPSQAPVMHVNPTSTVGLGISVPTVTVI